MSGAFRTPLLALLLALPAAASAAPATGAPAAFGAPQLRTPPEVELGIDVLEAEGFAPLRGKRFGLLTHRAGVDRNGASTLDVLRRAPGLHLVALFATENGISGNVTSGKIYGDQVDPRTGLMVYSLYNGNLQLAHQPSAAQLRGLDALVIDLQDIGSRSYTFTGAMKQAMEGCFLHHVEVIVLDRPNPLGGLKADGPMLDPQWVGPNLVNAFPVPYVHGLTIGELARLARYQPGILRIPDAVRLQGRLTVIAMRGWRRSMRWPETGLTWVPTSPFIPDFAAVAGYPMTGLGTFPGIANFSHGVGKHPDGSPQYPFRGISHKTVKPEVLEKELNALHLPGLNFRRISVPNTKAGLPPASGLFIEITDWDAWRPTELNFYLMQLDCRFSARNPYAAARAGDASGFLRHLGSTAFFNDLAVHGARVDVAAYFRDWEAKAAAFREHSRQFWLYQ
jgi:uncharacterized protein YbbC (DUF1343 family)